MHEAKYKIRELFDGAMRVNHRVQVSEITKMVGDPFKFPEDEQRRLLGIGLDFEVKTYMRSIKPQLEHATPEEVQPMLAGIPAVLALSEGEGANHVRTLSANRTEFIAATQFLDKKAIETASKADGCRQLWKTVDYIWKNNPDMTLEEVLREHAKREDAARRDRGIPAIGTPAGVFGSPLPK